jgi:hypothetical protein
VEHTGQFFQSLKAWRSSFYGAKVHAGFLKNYRALVPDLVSGIRSAKRKCPRCKKLFITGFSMGGALATLALVDLSRKFPDLCGSVTTFGSPRVGNNKFATEVFPKSVCSQGLSRRVTRKGDKFVHLPPKFMGYRHVSYEYWNPGVSEKTQRLIIGNCDKDKFNGDNKRCSNNYRKRRFLPDHREYLGEKFSKLSGCEISKTRVAKLEVGNGDVVMGPIQEKPFQGPYLNLRG